MSEMPLSHLHDLHCHSYLSTCCHDQKCTADAIYAKAQAWGYDTLCLTDHLWDGDVPGASAWYEPQNIEHVLSSRPFIPAQGKTRCLLGCETEYCGGGKLGLAREHFDLFDFVVIPPNHFHKKGFVRPESIVNEPEIAELLVSRLEEISQLDIPMEKVGIAHITGLIYREGKDTDVFRALDQNRLRKAFDTFAKRGAGIELNASAFANMQEDPEAWLMPYRLAKEAGCKFYCSSDAHTLENYALVQQNLPQIISALKLTENDRYLIPG